MKTNKIPSVFVLWLYSWAIGLAGLFSGAYVIIFGSHDMRSFAFGFLIILAGVFCAALVRALANITQMIFDQNFQLFGLTELLSQQTDILSKLTHNMDMLHKTVEYINCDSKDLNQSSHQIRDFFEKIQRHLDINK